MYGVGGAAERGGAQELQEDTDGDPDPKAEAVSLGASASVHWLG